MKTVEIPIYEYDELSKEAQEKVVNDTINFLIEIINPGDEKNCTPGFLKACAEANAMHTPWFLGEMIWDYDKENVLRFCRYRMYFKDGSVYNQQNY